jgi:hypothetical protein
MSRVLSVRVRLEDPLLPSPAHIGEAMNRAPRGEYRSPESTAASRSATVTVVVEATQFGPDTDPKSRT